MRSEEVASIYNKKIKEKYNYEYEKARWFSSDTKKGGYNMTKRTIEYFLKNLEFQSCLEIGPGPGTWTKFFIKKNPDATYVLVDVSYEMLLLTKKSLKNTRNIQYINSGFLEYVIQKKFDFIFSSRAIEYITNKTFLVNKLYEVLNTGGEGLIITKNPKRVRALVRGIKVSKLHKFQIKPKILKNMLRNKDLTILHIFPVTFHFPFVKIPILDKLLFKIFGLKELNTLSNIFTESYCIHFKKV